MTETRRHPEPRRFDVPCTITVTHTNESLEAHVDLGAHMDRRVGDKIRVHGAAITVPFGDTITVHRIATVTRAGFLERAWVRLMAMFELKELYEVSFSPGSLR